jgi:hypothetical protein
MANKPMGSAYNKRMNTLNDMFSYITKREGYTLCDTWILHSDEIVEAFKINSMNSETKLRYLDAITAAIYHCAHIKIVKKQIIPYNNYIEFLMLQSKTEVKVE